MRSGMEKIIEQLEQIIFSYGDNLSLVTEEKFSVRNSPGKWSKKEELGHLIDSAHSNLRRFIVGQYEEHPKIVYDQNFWVVASAYQHQVSTNLITLWKSLNIQ